MIVTKQYGTLTLILIGTVRYLYLPRYLPAMVIRVEKWGLRGWGLGGGGGKVGHVCQKILRIR